MGRPFKRYVFTYQTVYKGKTIISKIAIKDKRLIPAIRRIVKIEEISEDDITDIKIINFYEETKDGTN